MIKGEKIYYESALQQQTTLPQQKPRANIQYQISLLTKNPNMPVSKLKSKVNPPSKSPYVPKRIYATTVERATPKNAGIVRTNSLFFIKQKQTTTLPITAIESPNKICQLFVSTFQAFLSNTVIMHPTNPIIVPQISNL
eukprot:403349398